MVLKFSDFLIKATNKFDDRYEYDESSWQGSTKLIKFKCPEHGWQKQQANVHVISKYGCGPCASLIRGYANAKTFVNFVDEATKIHGVAYQYFGNTFTKYSDKTDIKCAEHGIFSQTPSAHVGGQGCPECGKIKQGTKSRTQFKDFLIEAHKKHRHVTYYEEDWKGIDTHTRMHCDFHGEFARKPYEHLKSNFSCPRCRYDAPSKKRLSKEEYVEKANVANDYRYDYSRTIYTGLTEIITILCNDHGEFQRRANKHLLGRGCPKCKLEKQTSDAGTKWLDELDVPLREHRLADYGYIVDGYDPATNTVYQFHGDFWHGNPLRFSADEINGRNKLSYGELFKKTCRLDQRVVDLGYNLVVKWEMKGLKNQPEPITFVLRTLSQNTVDDTKL